MKWLATDILRDAFRQDLLYSFGAIVTVCEVQRHDALKPVFAVAKGERDPGYGGTPDLPIKSQVTGEMVGEEVDQTVNLELIARDQIERRISSVFTGYGSQTSSRRS